MLLQTFFSFRDFKVGKLDKDLFVQQKLEVIAALSKLGEDFSSFQDINLSLNLMDDEGSVPLLKAISLDKNIQGFSLSSNR